MPGVLGRLGAHARRDVPVAADPSPSQNDPYMDGFRSGEIKGSQDALAQAREQARNEGRQQGVAQGLREGRETAIQEVGREAELLHQGLLARIEKLDACLVAFSEQLHLRLNARLDAAGDEMIALCHEVICRLVGEQAVQRPVVAAMVRAAIVECCGAEGSTRDPLTVRVHPGDLDALASDEGLASWLARQDVRGVRWRSDPRVALGGCIVESSRGRLDARLEAQLAALRETLHDRHGVAVTPTRSEQPLNTDMIPGDGP